MTICVVDIASEFLLTLMLDLLISNKKKKPHLLVPSLGCTIFV